MIARPSWSSVRPRRSLKDWVFASCTRPSWQAGSSSRSKTIGSRAVRVHACQGAASAAFGQRTFAVFLASFLGIARGSLGCEGHGLNRTFSAKFDDMPTSWKLIPSFVFIAEAASARQQKQRWKNITSCIVEKRHRMQNYNRYGNQ